MGVWRGSPGRLGGSQPLARQPVFDPALLLSTRTKTDGIGLFTGQIGYAWNAALFYVKGGAAVTSNRFSILDTFTGIELASASATRWGATVGVGLSTASHRTGRSVLNTTTCLWAMPIIRSRASLRLPPTLPTTGSPKTWIWSPCASTTASVVTVWGRRSQRDTDLALFRLLQQTRSAEMPAFLLEVTCLKNPSGPRPAHNQLPSKPLLIA